MSVSHKIIYLLLLLAFIFSSSAAIASMYRDTMDQMTGCPFMGTDAICQMGIFEHIGIFQSMFSGVPVRSIFAIILLVFLAVSLSITKIKSPPNALKFLIKESLHLPNFNRILIALSNGRLQPKLYA